jgi:beta-xylosidase
MAVIKNPIVEGWYADPEARFYEGRYYIYVTRSFTRYEDQMNLDAFSSDDLVHWEKHEGIIDMSGFPHITRAVWAPTIIEKNGKYYLIFASNDIHSDDEPGGLEIAVSDSPAGPFTAYLEHPLVERFVNGAQPIDAHLFKDDDGTIYLYYGGWSHCNAAILNEEMTGFLPLPDGEYFKEITPPSYVEGPCMFRKGDDYYFMWSSGNWTDGTYHVAYAKSQSPLGPFTQSNVILERQEKVAEGPGHHGYLYLPEKDQWLIVYHRRYLGDTEAGHRVLCIDRMEWKKDRILPVTMTIEWELS